SPAAATAKPMPRPRAKTLRLSSSAASSSSRRTIELVRSATCLTAAPTPCESVSWVGMASPVDPFRQHDPSNERDADDEERIRPAAALLLLFALAKLRARRRQWRLPRLLVRRRLALRARLDQARLQLADEVGVLRERLGELRLDAALAGHLIRELLQLVCRALDFLIAGRHFFVGGSSPVSGRQMPEAARRETIVARAPTAPYGAVQSSL